MFLASVPSFVIGFALLILFAFTWKLLPSSGTAGVRVAHPPSRDTRLILFGPLSQVLRNELEEVLEQPFVLTARARG